MSKKLSSTEASVLLVEDNSVDVFINTKLLNVIGVREGIRVAPNGKQALEMINSNVGPSTSRPDVILLDLHMPVMNGFEFIEALNASNLSGKEKILTVIVSCSNWPADMERANSLGVKNYLTKPVSPADIRRVLEEHGILAEQ